jgi:hypothetical protein
MSNAKAVIRARKKAEFSNFSNDALDLIAIMKSDLTSDEWEDILTTVYLAKDGDEAENAIIDFYNDCY